MKKCTKCNEVKSFSEFNKNKAKKDGHQVYCRACMNKSSKLHYEGNKQSYLDRNVTRKNKIRDYINDVKSKTPCSCGESRIACLQFHHLDGESKDFVLARAVQSKYSLKKIKEEIDKCVIICANCHLCLHDDIRKNKSAD